MLFMSALSLNIIFLSFSLRIDSFFQMPFSGVISLNNKMLDVIYGDGVIS